MCTQELRGSSRVLSENKSMSKDKTPYSIYPRFLRQQHLEMEMELVVSEIERRGGGLKGQRREFCADGIVLNFDCVNAYIPTVSLLYSARCY